MEHLEDAGTGGVEKPPVETERLRRAKFLKQARKVMPYVSVVANGDVFFVPTDDYRIGANLFTRSRSKDMLVLPRALRLLDKLDHWLPKEPVFVDVGANLGTATITALKHHEFSSAVALEPSPGNFKALKLALIANDVDDRVQALPLAASDREGERALDVSRKSSGAHRLVSEGDVISEEESVVVQAVTLDSLVSQGIINPERAGLLWVDTAGHEAQALAGATLLLEARVPIVTAVKRGTGREALHELLSPHYAHVADLRKPEAQRSIGEFQALMEGVERSTDILLAP